MYWKDIWRFECSTEYEYKYAGRYGAKGEKRAKRKKPTPEQIKKQNQINREKKMRRLIKANFARDDLWLCLKYLKGTRKPLSEVKRDLRRFLAALRREYKKRGHELKFIYRLEIGKNGGIHIHMLVNRVPGEPHIDIIIQRLWNHGRVNYGSIYEAGGYQRLASYIVKRPDATEEGQISLFADITDEDKKELSKYSSSRNLVRPEPERTVYRRRTLRKLIEEGPRATPGYYIDPDTVITGVNPYTGMSYLHYTEVRIPNNRRRGSPGQ